MSYKAIAERKKTEQAARIPEAWKMDTSDLLNSSKKNITKQLDAKFWSKRLNEKETEITTGKDAVDIVAGIREGTWSAEEVTTAFCKRAAVAHQLTNCLTEMFFDKAIEQARALDQDRKAHLDKPLGPLYGLPVSLKDSYQVPGVDASIGLACFAFKPSNSRSPLVEILVSLGAILYCKTNVSQLLMTADSENNVFGRTINPHNRDLTAGGSTGGEGPLIALGGSVLGFGTDIAGSLRIPALCNGIYGFKPSVLMMPFSEQRMPFAPGWEGIGIVASAGSMANSVRGCSFALETILNAVPANLDPTCLRIPWSEDVELKRLESSKNLRIGVMADDGLFTPTPPMKRAIREAIEKLQASGVTIIPVNLPSMQEALPIIGEMLAVNGSEYAMRLLASTKEPVTASLGKLGLLAGSPKTMGEYFELNQKRQKIELEYNKLWSDHNLDAIIMPPAPHTAVPHDTWETVSYTAIWNLLDYPCFVLPTGTVEETDMVDESGKNPKFYSEGDKQMHRLYDESPAAYVDAPIAVQLVGRRHNDQALTVIAGAVDEILR